MESQQVEVERSDFTERAEHDHDHDLELDDGDDGGHSHSHGARESAFTSAPFSEEHDGTLAGVPSKELSSRWQHPLLMFGTYKVGVIPASSATGGSVTRSTTQVISDALAAGYRAFDCAAFYGNEKDVGTALSLSGVPRWELFLVSKVWTSAIYKGPEAVKEQVRQTLHDLEVSYLDAMLIHWPVPGKHVEAYKALEDLYREGRIRTLGVSNYTVEDYLELEAVAKVKPAICQLEISPWLYRKNTVDFFVSKDVVLQSYRTLRQGKATEDPVVVEIAAKIGRTPAQVVGRWCVQHGFVFMPKSQTPERMKENSQVFDFKLADDDMAKLDGLTTEQAIKDWRKAYDIGVVRDTPLQGTLDVTTTTVTED